MFQNVKVSAGQKYTFSVKVVNSVAAGDTLKLRKGYIKAEFHDSSMVLLSSSVPAIYDPATTSTPLDRWETLSGSITAPAGAATGRIVLGLKDPRAGAKGPLDFDSASVRAVVSND